MFSPSSFFSQGGRGSTPSSHKRGDCGRRRNPKRETGFFIPGKISGRRKRVPERIFMCRSTTLSVIKKGKNGDEVNQWQKRL